MSPPPGSPMGPYRDRCPFPELSFTYLPESPIDRVSRKNINYLFLKVPGTGAPIHVPPMGPLWRKMLHFQSHWFIHSFMSVRVPNTEPSHKKQGKYLFTVHRAPRGQKAYIQWGAAWFPKGIVYDTAISTPVPRSPQHDTFHLSLGRLEPR